MQAIILAAGKGSRLGELTAENTKCMVDVNGIRLIDRVLLQLADLSISRIVIVTGYKGQNLRRHIRRTYPHLPVVFVNNLKYDTTNNIYSLWLAREYMQEDDSLLIESDLIFKEEILKSAIKSDSEALALISPYESWMDGTVVQIDSHNDILRFIPKKDFDPEEISTYYKTVNIYKFSKEFSAETYFPCMEEFMSREGKNEYYEEVLRVITSSGKAVIKGGIVDTSLWYEIDDKQDLHKAEQLFK